MLGGICGAGDGFVVKISEPVKSDLDGRPSKIYMNRKRFFALLVQAFCGAHTNFWFFRLVLSGRLARCHERNYGVQTDCTAQEFHEQIASDLYCIGRIYWTYVSYVLDEVYSSIGGCHLTPFISHQLKKHTCLMIFLKLCTIKYAHLITLYLLKELQLKGYSDSS